MAHHLGHAQTIRWTRKGRVFLRREGFRAADSIQTVNIYRKQDKRDEYTPPADQADE